MNFKFQNFKEKENDYARVQIFRNISAMSQIFESFWTLVLFPVKLNSSLNKEYLFPFFFSDNK